MCACRPDAHTHTHANHCTAEMETQVTKLQLQKVQMEHAAASKELEFMKDRMKTQSTSVEGASSCLKSSACDVCAYTIVLFFSWFLRKCVNMSCRLVCVADRVAARDAVLQDHKEQLRLAHADLERALTDSLALSKDLNEAQRDLTHQRSKNTLLEASAALSTISSLPTPAATCQHHAVAVVYYHC